MQNIRKKNKKEGSVKFETPTRNTTGDTSKKHISVRVCFRARVKSASPAKISRPDIYIYIYILEIIVGRFCSPLFFFFFLLSFPSRYNQMYFFLFFFFYRGDRERKGRKESLAVPGSTSFPQ